MKAFRVALAEAKAKYFNTPYGEKQIQLLILATLPEYRRMGAGSMLSRWGMEYARGEGLAVTLFASPDGFKLYSRLGFKKVGEAETRVDGEEDRIVNRVMVLDPAENV
jgi:ribosomal protein S18 acetylase RimI-like enzyme